MVLRLSTVYTGGGTGLLSRAGETAYYLNGKLPRLALIGRGVRFPAGTWLRVANGDLPAWKVEALVVDLFVALKRRPLRIAILLTAFDVEEFEKEIGEDPSEGERGTG
jgi:hypothetical protein